MGLINDLLIVSAHGAVDLMPGGGAE